jgi:hypothetical protein
MDGRAARKLVFIGITEQQLIMRLKNQYPVYEVRRHLNAVKK